MRLSEKTLELSITAQLTQRLAIPNAIWFGLTQKEERQFGYDVAGEVAGRLLIFQFKASNVIVHPRRFANPRRRFTLPHEQLMNLRDLADLFPESVFYVFPNIGTEAELRLNQDLIVQSWLLPLDILPNPIAAPRNRSQNHLAYIDPPQCEVRSEPFETTLKSFANLREMPPHFGGDSIEMVTHLKEMEFDFKGMRAYGLFIPQI